MQWQVIIPGDDKNSRATSILIEADNWFSALRNGLAKHGVDGKLVSNVSCDIQPDHSVKVTDFVTRRTYTLRPIAPPKAAKDDERTRVSLPPGLPSHAIFYSRDEAPSDGSGIFYRERLIAVEPGTVREDAGLVAKSYFEQLRDMGATEGTKLFISIQVFDHSFKERSQRPALAALTWKEWNPKKPKILFPLSGGDGVTFSGLPQAAAPQCSADPFPSEPQPIVSTDDFPTDPNMAVASEFLPDEQDWQQEGRAGSSHKRISISADPHPSYPPDTTVNDPFPSESLPFFRRMPIVDDEPVAEDVLDVASSSSRADLAQARPLRNASPRKQETFSASIELSAEPAPLDLALQRALEEEAQRLAPEKAQAQKQRFAAVEQPGEPRASEHSISYPQLPKIKTDPAFRLEDKLVHAFEQMQSIYDTTDQPSAAKFVLRIARDLVDCEAGSVMLIEPSHLALRVVAAEGTYASQVQGKRLPLKTGVIGFATRSSSIVSVTDPSRDPRFDPSVDEKSGFKTKSILVAPVQHEGRTVGAIELLNSPRASGFVQAESNLLSYCCGVLAEYIVNHLLAVQPDLTDRDLAGGAPSAASAQRPHQTNVKPVKHGEAAASSSQHKAPPPQQKRPAPPQAQSKSERITGSNLGSSKKKKKKKR